MIFGMLVCLVLEAGPPDMIMMGTLICFIPLGILNVEQALHGFSDNAMLSIGVLFIVAKGETLASPKSIDQRKCHDLKVSSHKTGSFEGSSTFAPKSAGE